MNVWQIINRIKRFIYDFLILLTEHLFGIYTFQRIVSNNRLGIAERTDLVETHLPNEIDWDTDSDLDKADELLKDNFLEDKQQREDMVRKLSLSFSHIRGNKRLRESVEKLRSTAYDVNNPEHEKKLMKLWSLLKPNEKLISRKSLQWQEIGFQGDDPSTDFRGMGLLGLENLIYYAQNDPENCRRLLELSEHEVYGFPFAIAGITFTALCKQLLFENCLKNHFYNTTKPCPTLENFNQVYCKIFNLFGDYWRDKKPESVMFFNSVKNDFVELLKKYLKKSKADLFRADLVALSVK